MLNILLVDDEEIILDGILKLIEMQAMDDLNICCASNAYEALEILKKTKIDLMISDIRMPGMSGLELMEKIKKEKIEIPSIALLTGFAEFEYAKQALSLGVMEYLLKPVSQKEIIRVIDLAKDRKRQVISAKASDDEKMQIAYLKLNLMSILKGKFDENNLSYVNEKLALEGPIRYVEINVLENLENDTILDSERFLLQKEIYGIAREYLGRYRDHCIMDTSLEKSIYDVGIIISSEMMGKVEIDDYVEKLKAFLKQRIRADICLFVGKSVNSIALLAHSYANVCMLRSTYEFREKRAIYFYEKELQVNTTNIFFLHKEIGDLIKAVEENSAEQIKYEVTSLFSKLKNSDENILSMHINYFIFQLINIAGELDKDLDSEDVVRNLGLLSLNDKIKRGGREHIEKFAIEFSSYLQELRKNNGDVLSNIEKEIKERYYENITLKELSKKYYINTAYLGQLFKKKYAKPFKDYLNTIRIQQSEKLLMNTSKKIGEIAQMVGYNDVDYFVDRFVLEKGVSPSKYKKMVISGMWEGTRSDACE